MTMTDPPAPFPCAHINLAALRHNIQRLRQLAPASRLMAVVKANAYGHGILPVAQALAGYSGLHIGSGVERCIENFSGRHNVSSLVDGFAVARLDEALCLREAGIRQPIILLEGFFSAVQLPLIIQQQLQITVHSVEQLRVLEQTRLPAPVSVWLKLDSGMHRLGFPPEQIRTAYARLSACASVRQPVHLLSHFACADGTDSTYSEQQIACFYHCMAQCMEQHTGTDTEKYQQSSSEHSPRNITKNSLVTGVTKHSTGNRPQRSLAASAAILRYPQAHADWVRPGIVLYGVSPLTDSNNAAELGFRPVMNLSSQLIAVRAHPANASVGYGGRWRSSQPTRLGVIALGYGDGYPQTAPDGTPVLINGREVPIVGRVSMDMICVDLGLHSTDKAGDSVILWGEALPVERIARVSNSSPYELLTRLTLRLNYKYHDNHINTV